VPKLVLIIRHGEKPGAGDVHLAPEGYQCAGALAALFDAGRNGGAHPAIDPLFVTATRPRAHARSVCRARSAGLA
jgi:hypothetical protein